jgi:hypothetical protein
MLAAIDGIRQVLDRYGVKGTWEVVARTASGLCAYGGEEHIFAQLIAGGHEIGAHAHSLDEIEPAYRALVDDCGIQPVTNSGFIAMIGDERIADPTVAMNSALGASLELGMTVGTVNLNPEGGRNLLADSCADGFGVGNTMWLASGNLMFPWRPDLLSGDICADTKSSPVTLVDHVSIEWMILAEASGPPDVLSGEHFDQLRDMFEGALAYMENERPARPAVWGFVTHISEYAPGSQAESPPIDSALDALNEFLAYVESASLDGRVRYATASEIAQLVALGD